MEIYNELIKDLLNPSGPLELREDNRGQRITVAGLSEITATNRQEVIQLLIRGNKQRTMEPTLGKFDRKKQNKKIQNHCRALIICNQRI